MASLSLGKIEPKMLPLLIGSICCFLNRFIHNYNSSFILLQNSILTNISISSSKIFAIIPLIIIKLRAKHVSHKDIEKTNPDTLIENIESDKKVSTFKSKTLFILLSSTIFFVNQLFYVLTLQIKSNTSIVIILFTSIFYYFIFKMKLFKHHYLSIVLIILIGFVIDIILGNFQTDVNNNLGLFFLRFLREILYSLSSVVDKYVMEYKFISVYILLLCHGLIHSTLFIIIAIFDYNFNMLNDNYEEFFATFDKYELLVLFGVLVTQFGINLSILMTNKYYTPCHICIVFIFGQFAYYLYDIKLITIIVILCLILVLFFTLIFNEIILLNFWGLSNNTKENIMIRADHEDFNILTKMSTIDSTEDKIELVKERDEDSNAIEDTEIYEKAN